MIVKIITLEGNSYKITFNDDITINKIKQKLLLEYNFNADRYIFCLDGKIINDESNLLDLFALMKHEIAIVAINHSKCHERSYPKVDDAFHFNFSRYFDDFVLQNSDQKNENQVNNCDLNSSFVSVSESESNDDNDNISTTNQFNEEFTNDLNINNFIQSDQQELEADIIIDQINQRFTTMENRLQEMIQSINEITSNISFGRENQSEINMQIIESLNISIELTEEDNHSITRLVSAGHDRANVIQIFAICNKNEEMALNILSTMD